MNYKIAQFILTPPQRSQSMLEIYVSQPDANKEALAGKLFALIEIESKRADNLKIINFLINTLNHAYYQNEKMILRERVSSIKIEHIFESALAKTNKRLAEFLQAEKIKLNPEAMNVTIGVVFNDSLHFANLGKNKALLIYKNKSDETARYKLADITEQTDGGGAKKASSPAKLFSNVVSGSLPRGGYFVFANETFSEYLSAKQIIGIVSTLPPAGAAEQIKNTLSSINAYVPFLGIIIKNTAGLETHEVKAKPAPVSTQASINDLNVTEEKTEKLLTPSGLVSMKKWSDSFNGLLNRSNAGKKIGANAFLLKDKIFTKRKPAWLSPAKLFGYLKGMALYIAGLLVFIFKIVTDKKALTEFFGSLYSKAVNFIASIKRAAVNSYFWYKNLNKTNKILLSAFLVCVLALIGNLSYQGVKNKAAEKQAAYGELTSNIEQKQNQIDASLLYNNEEGARKLLEEVKSLLAELPSKTQAQKEIYRVLEAKNQVQLSKISRVITVDPVELANFSNLNALAKPENIMLANGKIFAADAARSAIYSIDLSSKLISTIGLNSQNVGSLNFPSLDGSGGIYYLNLPSSLIVLDSKTEKTSTLAVEFSGNLANAIDLKQYNNRFYLTDVSAGQIYRLAKSADKIANAAPWLNGQPDLSGVTGMDIDGSVYLLKNDGTVEKFSKGQEQNFSLSVIEPAMSHASKIIAASDQNYIYILEPSGKRLAVFDKNGKLIGQYTSDKFNGLKDVQIDEKAKKIYFLNGSSVYSIDADFLNKK